MDKLFNCKLDFVREDDFVEYFLFPQLPDSASRSESELRIILDAALSQCNQITKRVVNERSYIWHKDEFHLQPRTGSAEERLLNDEATREEGLDAALPPHLHGVTHYGDNIADEWFIVHLVCTLTREISGCIARVIDSDGEFLLIEAADVLPKWANPDTCEQRVFIVDGCLQLVQNSPSNTAKLMPVATAVAKIQQNSTLYRVSREIQTCIDDRLKEFQTPTNAAIHNQIVHLPLGVAALLKQRPTLIAPAVRAFCERDPVDMKACRTMRFFPPEQRVRTNVRFTRCLYAMLMHSSYVPDRKIGWNLQGSTNTEQYKEDLLGVKIACGFEILASQAKTADNAENEPAWRTYVRSLTTKGYFRDNLEGSEEYKRLLAEARAYYVRNNERFRTAPLVGKEIVELLQGIDINAKQLRDQENNLQASDSDDWLNISAEQLDAMLLERYGPKKLYKPNGDINAEEFTRNITEFLEKESGFDGIENDSDDDFDVDEDDELASSASKRSHEFGAKVKKNNSMRKACKQNSVINTGKQDTPTITATKQKKQHFDDNGDDDKNINTHVRNFLDFVIPEDNWDSNSDMSDYEDDADLERNIESMNNSELNIDMDIQTYMAQMDKELAKTTMGQTFELKGAHGATAATASGATIDDDFDDIETFKPININVNTLKNMMDSYKSQIGGAGPVSNLFNAMGVGMSAASSSATHDDDDEPAKKLSESRV